MFSFKSISLLFTQIRVSPLANWPKQQQFTPIVNILHVCFAYKNNCSLHIYNRDLQATIILFTRNVSSHKTEWTLSESPLFALPCQYRMVSSLMNALTENVFTCSVVKCFVYPLFYFTSVVVTCLLLYPLFYTDVVAIFLFVRWSCRQARYISLWSFCSSFKEHELYWRLR